MNRESREEVLARLLAGALGLLDRTPALLQDTAEGGEFAGEIDGLIDDCREFMGSLVKTQWAPGEAPPGVEALQAEVREAQAEVAAAERKANRNKRKAGARKAPGRKPN